MATEDAKTADVKQETVEMINLKVTGSDGNEVHFKVKKNTVFSKLFQAYADRVGRPMANIRFMFDGARVNKDSTPATLEMEDNDTIDAMVEQTGGF